MQCGLMLCALTSWICDTARQRWRGEALQGGEKSAHLQEGGVELAGVRGREDNRLAGLEQPCGQQPTGVFLNVLRQNVEGVMPGVRSQSSEVGRLGFTLTFSVYLMQRQSETVPARFWRVQ